MRQIVIIPTKENSVGEQGERDKGERGKGEREKSERTIFFSLSLSLSFSLHCQSDNASFVEG